MGVSGGREGEGEGGGGSVGVNVRVGVIAWVKKAGCGWGSLDCCRKSQYWSETRYNANAFCTEISACLRR